MYQAGSEGCRGELAGLLGVPRYPSGWCRRSAVSNAELLSYGLPRRTIVLTRGEKPVIPECSDHQPDVPSPRWRSD